MAGAEAQTRWELVGGIGEGEICGAAAAKGADGGEEGGICVATAAAMGVDGAAVMGADGAAVMGADGAAARRRCRGPEAHAVREGGGEAGGFFWVVEVNA